VKSTALRVGAICIIGGVTYEVAQFVCNYALNSIPTAYAVLAVGINIRTGRPSAVHDGIEQVAADGYMQPASIHIKLGDGSEDYVKIFDGYLTGLGYTRSDGGQGQVNLVAHLTHWLVDLTFSTAVTQVSQPINAAQLNTSAIYQSSLGAEGEGSYFFHDMAYGDSYNSFYSDVGLGVLSLFEAVCDFDVLQPGDATACFGTGGGNAIGKRALAKFVTSGGIGGGGAGGYAAGGGGSQKGFSGAVPALFTTSIGSSIWDSMVTWMHRTMDESYFTTGLWDKLVGLIAPSFKLAVVPLVNRALLVPYAPCVQAVGGSIYRTEVVSCEFQSQIPRPVRAVNVLGGVQNRTGAFGPSESPESATYGLNGCFSRGERPGAVLFIDAPSWLRDVPALTADVEGTALGATGDGMWEPTPTATTPGEPDSFADPAAVSPETASVYRRLAESYYWQELLRGRTGSISTNFRWDIAPGSSIAVYVAGSQKFGRDPLVGRVMVGSVERLTMWADCAGSRCGTAYQLSFCRSSNENTDMSAKQHPLYDGNVFTGASLL
jgi:hypothetical protein